MVEQTPEQPIAVLSAKDEILNRVRGALGERNGDRESEYAYISRNYQMKGTSAPELVHETFVERLHDYGASVFECNEASIANAVEAALKERGLMGMVVGRDFPASWIPSGFTFTRDDGQNYRQLDSFEGVVTGCALAIATTGTIILRHAEDEPRRALSLIPDYHLCIVFEQQMVETVPEGVRQMAAMGKVPLTTISGPSATADIEMTRIQGVHGPRNLDVIIVRG